MVALSTADTNKWATLLNRGHSTPEPQVTRFDYERTGPIRQRQRRLSEAQALLMADKYQAGATVYQLAQEFGISRQTVSGRLKKVGAKMRGRSPDNELIDSMVGLYESGYSLAAVGNRVGTSPRTVHRYNRLRGVQMRDSHGR
ncbi:MAG: helix-turn-helix domain-containing protein [Candidatus Planktophila sp.]|nr:helix-turn-helix domain-containing protein [Candidatus Planktophila sp.]